MIRDAPYNAETPRSHMTNAITPSPSVYVRCNFEVPALPSLDHVISVTGAVKDPFRLTVGELSRMRTSRLICTMECAGNNRAAMLPLPAGEPWSSGAVSTAEWVGVPLLEILERAAPLGGALEVLVEGADKGTRDDESAPFAFARSLPIDAIRADVLLAFQMNGAPLSPHHGAPVRLVVPGWYGMASVKWVSQIRVLSKSYAGYFQAKRYVYDTGGQLAPVTRMRVKSIVVSPEPDTIVPVGNLSVWGWAWSGEAAIQSVQLSAGAEEPWIDATLEEQSSPHAWVRWHCAIQLKRPGRHVLRCRATDRAGNSQPSVSEWNRFGYGNNSIQPVTVVARK